jgi:methylase of polypeptide subunit release factors
MRKYPTCNFYDEVMEDLFFKALNTKRENNLIKLGDEEHTIPYLNGGLFEEDPYDKTDLTIPNQDFKKIIDLFDSYNFTVIEDTPHDSEIAIDPEMLGRVFEDLLEDRKEKGAFYTPREIVHYMSKKSIENYLETELKEYRYDFSLNEFLQKIKLSDEKVLEFYQAHPVKFLKIDNYFEKLHPYKNLVVDFFMVAKLRGLWLDSSGKRVKNSTKAHIEITANIWEIILTKQYTVIGVNFGSNKEFKTENKKYKYPTILKYIKIEQKYFTLAFLPNISGDLELTTIFPIRLKEIKRKIQKIGKNLEEITKEDFSFDSTIYEKIKELQEDCRPLHTEPLSLFQVEELPRQAVVQKGLSTFYNSFSERSVANEGLKKLFTDFNYYDKFINTILNHSNTPQDHLKKLMIIVLNKIKVLDPAIGSGAFPMGILHEIVEARVHLGDKTKIADMKRKIIENSIYGVDIEPSAVEIAKLRFWLSIVVDEDIDINKNNPRPLPNLAYKIMVGNSLIETVNGFDPLKLHGNKKEIKFLKEKFHRYFNATDNIIKTQINEEIQRNVLTVLQSGLKTFDIQPSLDMDKKEQKKHEANLEKHTLLKSIIDDYKKEGYSDQLFLYKIYFKEVLDEGGFDIVIGNPPYIFARDGAEKNLSQKVKDIFYKNFLLAKYQINLYILFFEKGYNLLKQNGIIGYIIPNNWMTINTNKDFREYILNMSNVTIINFLSKVFDSANVDSSIVIGQKSNNNLMTELYEFENKTSKKFIKRCSNNFLLSQKDSIINLDIFKNEKVFDLIYKIEGISQPLSLVAEVKAGLQAYEVGKGTPVQTKEMKNDRIYHSSIQIDNTYIKYLDGKDVQRYKLGWSKEYLKYGKNLAAPRGSFKLFSTPRILVRQIPSNPPYSINACYTEKTILNDRNSMNIIDIKINPQFLLAILNSKIITFWFIHKFGKLQRGIFPQFKINELKEFPIPKIKNIDDTKPFENLVDEIILKKQNNEDTTELENQIDQMVYTLYSLTKDEIAIVEGKNE